MERNSPIIVAIDDNNDNLVTLKAFVTDAFPDARIFTAQNGTEGIELAREHDPDVILLDIFMPVMDGFEVCRLLKQDPEIRDIPVVFLTAMKNDRASRIRALDLGGEAFISKPFDDAEFIAQIRAMVKIKAAAERKRDEKKYLARLVAERTIQLEKELAEKKKAEQELGQANQTLEKSKTAMLNLLEDLKEEVEARKKSEKRYRALVETSPDMIWEIDPDGTFRYISPQIRAVMGYEPEELIGRAVTYIIPEPSRSYVMGEIARHVAQKKPISTIQVPARNKDGRDLVIEIRSSPVFSDTGNLIGMQGVARDITDHKRATDMIAFTNRKLELINDVTYQYIQNKVTGLRGYAELSKDAKTDAERLSFIEKEERILADIHQLIKNTKDYQEMGVNQSRWIPLEQSIRIAVSLVSPDPDISIEINLHGLELYSDPLIEKIFSNLIENAVIHGKTTTRITFSSEETPGGLILVCEDDGVGIFPKDKARLFDRSVGENIHFGLFFIRECLDLAGMTITENGTPGKGARFEIIVPRGAWRMNPDTGNGHGGET